MSLGHGPQRIRSRARRGPTTCRRTRNPLALNRPSHLWWQAGIMLDDDPTFRHRQVTVAGSSLHVVETGAPEADPFLFLHGWPESWHSWRQIMTMASRQVRAIAIDLPGVGESTGDPTDGSKRQLAVVVHDLVETMGLRNLTLVGQDVGGMVTYAYLRAFPDLRQSVIMDVVIPGRHPWEQVLANPYLWHFAFHSIPELPERLVQGHQGGVLRLLLRRHLGRPVEDYRRGPGGVCAGLRHRQCSEPLGSTGTATFPQDAAANKEANSQAPTATPLLYLRGEKEGGQINDYLDGLRSAGSDPRRARAGAERRTLHARRSARGHVAIDR